MTDRNKYNQGSKSRASYHSLIYDKRVGTYFLVGILFIK